MTDLLAKRSRYYRVDREKTQGRKAVLEWQAFGRSVKRLL